MSRKKRKQFRDFESSAVLDDFKEPYVCMTRSMLISEKWNNLSYPTQKIYWYMKLWSYGKVEFEFSYSLALNVVGSRKTFKKAIDELVKNGFIEITRISRTPGIGSYYKFTNKWYK